VRIIESIERELEKRNDELEWAHEMMNTDLRMAVNVQQSFFCRDIPQPEGYDISLYFKPLMEVSGDFYDFVLDGDRMKGIALFDVSGHGVASALITMIAKSIVDRHFKPDCRDSLGTVLSAINNDLVREIGMTRNYLAGMIIMLKENSFDYVNAGYQDIIIKKNSTGEIVIPDGEGFRSSFLGIPAFTCEVESINVPFEKGDVLFLFSDGLVEGENIEGKIYGFENIASSIRNISSDATLHDLSSTVMRDFFSFIGTKRLLDDITLIVVKKTS